jgi:hypothetical protein
MRIPTAIFLLGTLALACGARTGLPADQDNGITGPDAGVPPRHLAPADKVDLLFMIDNSASMSDKQALLKEAVPDLLDRLVNPRCVDANDPNKVVGTSSGGTCAAGVLEFPAVHDLHVGIVTSSLGGRGSDACPPEQNPANPSLDAHNDDNGHLVMRGGADEHAIPDGQPSNFLAWFPPGGTNQNGARPSVTPIQDPKRFASDFQDLVAGIHEFGCGFEAQLESWYRFLIQPDPYGAIVVENGRARLDGSDDVILQQRHDFLRPDSLVAIVLVTDENDSVVDPMSLSKQGWAYENREFPGSPGGGSPRATYACSVDPNDPGCTSCKLVTGSDPARDRSCAINGGWYTTDEDPTNERFFHMKQRFGVDPQFPVQRYVDALTSGAVPNRGGEYDGDTYVAKKNCVNPLFAMNLPQSSHDETCKLDRGPRSLDLVYFAIIGGVPNQLLHFDPQSPANSRLDDADWLKILGRDPLHYDFTGADPHMLESTAPRPGLPGIGASNTADPIHGREWDTKGADLQYACTFPLASPRDCGSAAVTVTAGCDCATKPSPLCDESNPQIQVRGKAYPPVRELVVARGLGDQAIVASLCPIHAVATSADDPLYGYRPAMKTIIDRLKLGLQ